ncbi:MAG: GFA family protein [Methylobacteriaceae bacterium]|nr:GFA family protein [Methylobacteriaceae bacterium]
MTLKLPLIGGCACGAVRYEVSGQPLMVTICHCTICQKRTGSAFSMNMLVLRDDFSLVKGQTISRELPTGGSHPNIQHICEHCFVRTHTQPIEHPRLVFVRPGTLDRPDAVEPIVQIWNRNARPWARITGLKCFEENLEEAPDLVDRWRAAHPVAET